MATHAANGRTELQMMRDDYLRDLRTYSQLVGRCFPAVIYKQLCGARDRYAEAGGDLQDLGNLPTPTWDGRAPFISGIPDK